MNAVSGEHVFPRKIGQNYCIDTCNVSVRYKTNYKTISGTLTTLTTCFINCKKRNLAGEEIQIFWEMPRYYMVRLKERLSEFIPIF